jgi:hypothetical protein
LIVAAIASPVFPQQSVLNLLRAWSRPEMSRAVLDALHAATTDHESERVAWLLKTVLAVEHSAEAVDRILDSAENAQVRRWLAEGLERLVLAGSLDWEQVGVVISVLAQEHQPTLLTALASLLGALPWRAGNIVLLEPLLLHPDHEVVSAVAHTLARHPETALQLDLKILDHLRAHSNPMMRHSAKILDESIHRGGHTKVL